MQKLYTLLLALLVSACSSLPDKTSTLVHPSEMQHWTLQGKIGVKALGESKSANFHWQNLDLERYKIRVHGPLGQGAAILEKDANGVSFKADGRTQRAVSAEELMNMNLGWSFPVAAMSWWVRGLSFPDLDVEQQQSNEQGQLQQLQQGGWQIDYAAYQQVGQLHLPAKLVARRMQNNVEVKLILKKWSL